MGFTFGKYQTLQFIVNTFCRIKLDLGVFINMVHYGFKNKMLYI